MNLTQFLKKVDAGVSDMNREQMILFIHELARTLPENRRNHFLELMGSAQAEGSFAENMHAKDERMKCDLQADIKKAEKVLTEINDGNRCLDSEYNEEWDDWYNSDAEEILFYDPEKLLPDIENSIDLLHRCVDTEAYKEGCELAELLCELEISVTGDYDDYDGTPLGIGELFEHELLNSSSERVIRESLFLTYMGNDLAARAEKIFYIIESYHCFDLKLEDIMQLGKHELPEFKDFLPLWINYLGNQTGQGAEKLLQEAQSMVEDEEQQLDTARRFVQRHPELYMEILRKGTEADENQRMFQIGMEAIEKISVSHSIRSEIALLTAEYACRINDNKASEYCWLEAFRSDISVVNYMRLCFLAENWAEYEKTVKQIYDEASVSSMVRYAVLFFEKRFEDVIQKGMNKKEALGWSSTFMKEGLAMFLLLLYKGDALPKGLRTMLSKTVSGCCFSEKQFLKGTCIKEVTGDEKLFWKLFCRWKANVNVSEEERVRWMKKIEQLVSKRVTGIMEESRRNYYGECAAFIAAYGEVMESQGVRGAKNQIMEKYRGEYPRRRSFIQELRNYGMF